MDKSEIWLIPAAGNPTVHPATMAIYSIPHHFAHEPADRFEARYAKELCHSERHIVAVALVYETPSFFYIRLATTGCNARIRVHFGNEKLKIPRWQAEVEIQLAEILKIVGTNPA